MQTTRISLAAALAALATAPALADEVNIYSSRHYDTDERALQRLHRRRPASR